MLESILVGVIIVAAAAFVFYRLVIRRSCGCGDDCGCSPEKKERLRMRHIREKDEIVLRYI